MTEKSNKPIVFQLPQHLVDDLDQAKIDFKKRISGKKRNRLSRSKLCEIILNTIIIDYQIEGDDSDLYEIVSNWVKKNTIL